MSATDGLAQKESKDYTAGTIIVKIDNRTANEDTNGDLCRRDDNNSFRQPSTNNIRTSRPMDDSFLFPAPRPRPFPMRHHMNRYSRNWDRCE